MSRGREFRNVAWVSIARQCRAWGAMVVLLAWLMWTTTGCGSSRGSYQWSSLHRDDVRSVHVPIFTNRSFARGVEFNLSKAIVNELEARTPYKVQPRQHADTILEGEIVNVSTGTVSHSLDTALPQEQTATLTVNFVWKDLRTGKILVDRRGFHQTASFYPTLGEGRFVGTQTAAEQLAKGIVEEMQTDW